MLSARKLINFTKYNKITPQIQFICRNQFYSTTPQSNCELNSGINRQININHQLITYNGVQQKTFIRQYANLPDLPSKSKVVKYTFKIIGLILDITKILITWTLKFIKNYIINNSLVQKGWRLLQKKIEDAKKD